MSTAIATTATPLTSRNPIRPQRLSTLLRVELRKLVDTRSGKAILGIGVAIPLAALVWMLFKGSEVAVSWRLSSTKGASLGSGPSSG